jgi:hypothetical protein
MHGELTDEWSGCRSERDASLPGDYGGRVNGLVALSRLDSGCRCYLPRDSGKLAREPSRRSRRTWRIDWNVSESRNEAGVAAVVYVFGYLHRKDGDA